MKTSIKMGDKPRADVGDTKIRKISKGAKHSIGTTAASFVHCPSAILHEEERFSMASNWTDALVVTRTKAGTFSVYARKYLEVMDTGASAKWSTLGKWGPVRGFTELESAISKAEAILDIRLDWNNAISALVTLDFAVAVNLANKYGIDNYVISERELAEILSGSAVLQRHTARLAYERRKEYEKYFRMVAPEWTKYLAPSFASDILRLALATRRAVPSEGPTVEYVRSVRNECLTNKYKAPSKYSEKTPEELKELLTLFQEGPYAQLLEVVQCLNANIYQEQKPLMDTVGHPWTALEAMTFGNPTKLIPPNSDGSFSFRASRMDGPYPSLDEIANLPWTDELNDGVWGNANWERILDSCPSVSVEEDYTLDEIPGQSDTYFNISVSDPCQLARELRVVMLSYTVYSDDRAAD